MTEFDAQQAYLRRLSMSTYRDKLVLKGGMLMAVLDALSPDFGDVVAEVVRFVDPLVADAGDLVAWLPEAGRWATSADVERNRSRRVALPGS